MIPDLLISPTVGLSPTIPQYVAGETIEPFVSVPTATEQRFAATAAAEPELEPEVFRSRAYGFRVNPPRALHPLVERDERKFAHSLRLVLPRITAPASRRRCTRNASRIGREPTSASEPAVVSILSAVSILSFSRMGIPCIGPRSSLRFRSRSRSRAISMASGFDSITELIAGPFRSNSSMRRKYAFVSPTAVILPDDIARCSSGIVASSHRNVSRVPPAREAGTAAEQASRLKKSRRCTAHIYRLCVRTQIPT